MIWPTKHRADLRLGWLVVAGHTGTGRASDIPMSHAIQISRTWRSYLAWRLWRALDLHRA